VNTGGDSRDVRRVNRKTEGVTVLYCIVAVAVELTNRRDAESLKECKCRRTTRRNVVYG